MYGRAFIAGVVSASVTFYTAYRYQTNLEPVTQLPASVHSDSIYQKTPQGTSRYFARFGLPQSSQTYVFHKNHIICYDRQRRIPMWVAEHIISEVLKGSANRKHSKFQPDPSIPLMFTAQNEDYLGSGWSRGHMAPAGDSKYDQEAMNATFYLSNILPQDQDNNNGFWNRLEIYCRDLCTTFDDVWVISGPLFLPETAANGKRYIRYEVIGRNEVAVPTHLFKVVVAQKNGKDPVMAAFVVPNMPLDSSRTLQEFKVDIQFIESRSGLSLLPLMPRQKTRDLCTVDSCRLKPLPEPRKRGQLPVAA